MRLKSSHVTTESFLNWGEKLQIPAVNKFAVNIEAEFALRTRFILCKLYIYVFFIQIMMEDFFQEKFIHESVVEV